MSILNRPGKFRISRRDIEDDPDGVVSFLSNFLIVRAEIMFVSNHIEYTAYSMLFDEVEGGEAIPEYTMLVRRKRELVSVEKM